MCKQHIPNLAWVVDNRCMPFPEASVCVDGLRPFIKIAMFHFILFTNLAFRLQHQHVAVFHADQKVRSVFPNNTTIDIENLEGQMIVLDPCCNRIVRCDVKRYFTRFQSFLHGYGFAPEKNISYTTLWVSRFLVFFNEREDQGARALIPESLNSLTTEHNASEWQVRQAEEVLRLYLIIMKAGTLQELRKPQKDGIGESAILEAMKRRIKVKYYSYTQIVHTSTGRSVFFDTWNRQKERAGFCL